MADKDLTGLVHQCANLAVGDEAKGISFLEEKASQLSAVDKPKSWAVVGRLLTPRPIKFDFMQHTMATTWQPLKGIRVIEFRPNLYEFQFFHQRRRNE